MTVPGADSVLVRHGDVGVKSSGVQKRMESKLRDNLAAMLERDEVDGDVEREWGRVIVRTHETDDPESAADRACDAAVHTFGVVSASPARIVEPELDTICETLADIAPEVYTGGTFAIDARRSGDVHDFTSHDVNQDGGTAVWHAVEDDFEPAVDLDDPDVTFYIEVREDEAFVFTEKRDGPGGLPLGTQAPLVALISGGIDSPVAAWLAMKRGSPVIPLYLDLGDYGGPDHRARAELTASSLQEWAPGFDLRMRVAPAGPAVERLGREVGRTRMLSFRRFMYRVAEHVADAEGAVGIVTGEAIGQKSSQTATNLGVVSDATHLPIHRPLVALDKQEIIAKARELGTYRDATIDAGCNRLAPGQPLTAADRESIVLDEPDDLLEMATAIAADVEVVGDDTTQADSGVVQ